MKTSMYFNYTSRALLRGGQRTLLAIFCVAVGVMAVVSLQLVGLMLQHSLTANVRETNGGDVAVTTPGVPLKPGDLTFFDQLKRAGTITNYTAVISATGGLNSTATSIQSFSVEAVDPGNYPLVTPPAFVGPGNGTFANLLTNDQVIVTQNFLDRYQKQLGDTFNLYIKTNTGLGQTLSVKITGVVANSGMFAQSGNLLLLSTQDYLATAPTALTRYSLIDITTADQAHTGAAVKAITAQFPLASTQTTLDVLKNQQYSVDLVNKFLEIAGLLALLIGGVGIVNTMQVLLSRRKTEIAMLKTAGYRRRDLYLLFGLEAGLIGLIGGIIGAVAATGVSYIVRGLMESLGFNILFELNFQVILSGVAIGFATALIFGLLPIAQAANVRPLLVIREFESRNGGGRALTLLMLVVLSVLFCLLATLILNRDLVLGIVATYGAFAFLLVLSAFFSLLIFAVSKLPVPERLDFKYVGLILVGIAVSALVYQVLPVFGIFLLAASLLGVVVVLLPRGWKASTRMALRNLGRRRARTMTTMLALFIGVYGIGLIVGLGHDVLTQTSSVVNQNAPYNLVATASGKESDALQARLSNIPGLTSHREDLFVASVPRAIDSRPIQQVLGKNLQSEIGVLGGIEGYNLAQNVPSVNISGGRNLNPGDANSNNVLVSAMMTSSGWFNMGLKPGSTVTLSSADGKQLRTVTVVGIISIPTSYENLGDVLAPASVVNALSVGSNAGTTVFYMKVPPAQINQALDTLGQFSPHAAVQNLTDGATAFLQEFSRILNMLVAIALLSVLAGVIIIANSVVLAMLERRRELGILKSVGYTSGTVMREILLENGIIGGVSAFIAMLLASSGVAIGGKLFFQASFSVEPLVVVFLVVGPVMLAMLTAALVSWRAVRVRPLEVLRYE
jgi:putative ABC transport system permease protein